MSARFSSLQPQILPSCAQSRRQCVFHRVQTRALRYHGPCAAAKNSVARTSPEGAQTSHQATIKTLDVDNSEEIWESFATNVSGEWEGVTATFTPSGEPEQLPEHYVPSAFRDWGVDLWDWQSQCSSTVSRDGCKQLKSTVRRLMPTVGCEADAIAFTEEQSGSSSSSMNDTASAAASNVLLIAKGDGSYNAGVRVWPQDEKVTSVQIEHCITLPQAESSQQKFRVKIVQNFKRAWTAGRPWKLASIDLHREKYEGPYTGKRELAGCGGGQTGIAQQQRLTEPEAAGTWRNCTDNEAVNHPAALLADTVWVDCIEGTCTKILLHSAELEPGSSALPDDATTSAESAAGMNFTLRALFPLGAWSFVRMDAAAGKVAEASAGVMLPYDDVEQQGHQQKRRVCSSRVYGEDGVIAWGAIQVQEQSQH